MPRERKQKNSDEMRWRTHKNVDPGNVLEERGDEASLTEVVLEKAIAEVTCAGEEGTVFQ